jgi:hypothetical protein
MMMVWLRHAQANVSRRRHPKDDLHMTNMHLMWVKLLVNTKDIALCSRAVKLVPRH